MYVPSSFQPHGDVGRGPDMTIVPPGQVSLSEAGYETLETTCIGVLRVFLKHDIFEGGCCNLVQKGPQLTPIRSKWRKELEATPGPSGSPGERCNGSVRQGSGSVPAHFFSVVCSWYMLT